MAVRTPLKKWIEETLNGRVLSPAMQKKAEQTLRYAGYSTGVPRNESTLAQAILEKAVEVAKQSRVAATRVAAVVLAGGNCPRCGGEMADVRLAENDPARYCRNPACRVVCHVKE